MLLLTHKGPARAGAFTLHEGEGLVIVGGTFSDAVRAYDASGRLVPVGAWRKFNLSAYGEYGLTDWLTLIGEPSWLTFRAKPPSSSFTGFGIAETGARARLYEWGANVISMQATVRAAPGRAFDRQFMDASRNVQLDARVLYARVIDVFGLPGFINSEIGLRTSGIFGNEVRADLTWGLRPIEPLLLLVQSFTALAPGAHGTAHKLSQKVQMSFVYTLLPGLSFQLGGIAAVRGINSSAERGIVSAIWYKF